MPRASYFLSLLVLFGACRTNAIGVEDVVGKYAINRRGVTDAIEVRADGSYAHSFGAGASVRSQGGTWQLELTGGEQVITFNEFVFHIEGHGSGKPAFWIVSPERVAGRTRLVVDDDVGLWYQQQTALE